MAPRTRAGRYDQKFISRYFSKLYRFHGIWRYFFFPMDDRVLTTFSTDWGKTAVDWLRMPYFSVMMSEYCKKFHINTGVKAKKYILTVNISSAKPHSAFWSIIKKILIKNESSEHGDIWLLKVIYRGIFFLPLQWHNLHLCQIKKFMFITI